MCGSDSDGEGDSTAGRLTLLLVDDPVDTVTSLNVTIESIEVHGNGPPTELTLNQDVDQPVNILELENGVFATLVDGNDNENVLPTGTYGNLKIHITEASITFTDDPEEAPTPASVPPDKFNVGGPFTISEGEITELYLVFHANNALHDNGGGEYTVHPSLKLVAKTVSGSIRGSVSALSGVVDCTKVKVFANRGDTDNEVSTFAKPDDGYFELVPLREGTHEVSAECLTLENDEVTACRVHVHGDEDVVAGQVTNIETPITIPEDAPEC
jgi:hypothetical protein